MFLVFQNRRQLEIFPVIKKLRNQPKPLHITESIEQNDKKVSPQHRLHIEFDAVSETRQKRQRKNTERLKSPSSRRRTPNSDYHYRNTMSAAKAAKPR
jgi:hypothetical protein